MSSRIVLRSCCLGRKVAARTVRRTVRDRSSMPDNLALRYLCFGGGDHVYLVHQPHARPSFDQVLTVRFVPGTVRTLVGHPLDDDVAALRFDEAQRVVFGRDDAAGHRLSAGEVVTASFTLTRSPGFARGFTVGVEVERELHLAIDGHIDGRDNS
jgi:hypothetical protein